MFILYLDCNSLILVLKFLLCFLTGIVSNGTSCPSNEASVNIEMYLQNRKPLTFHYLRKVIKGN